MRIIFVLFIFFVFAPPSQQNGFSDQKGSDPDSHNNTNELKVSSGVLQDKLRSSSQHNYMATTIPNQPDRFKRAPKPKPTPKRPKSTTKRRKKTPKRRKKTPKRRNPRNRNRVPAPAKLLRIGQKSTPGNRRQRNITTTAARRVLCRFDYYGSGPDFYYITKDPKDSSDVTQSEHFKRPHKPKPKVKSKLRKQTPKGRIPSTKRRVPARKRGNPAIKRRNHTNRRRAPAPAKPAGTKKKLAPGSGENRKPTLSMNRPKHNQCTTTIDYNEVDYSCGPSTTENNPSKVLLEMTRDLVLNFG